MAGGLVGAILYELVFAVDASVRKLAACIDEDHDSKYEQIHCKEGEHDQMPEMEEIIHEKPTTMKRR